MKFRQRLLTLYVEEINYSKINEYKSEILILEAKMEKETVFLTLQEFVRSRPILLIGSGLSLSMGLPGMKDLTKYLKTEIPKHFNDDIETKTEWESCIKRIERLGLEEGLGENKASDKLLDKIIEETANLVVNKDTEFRNKLFKESAFNFPLVKLIEHLIYSMSEDNPILDIITSNYDHLVEYACDILKIPCNTGFCGVFMQQFSEEHLRKDTYATRWVAVKGKRMKHYRKKKQVRLLKPHGSLNWFNIEAKCIQSVEPLTAASRAIITPGLTKYKESLTNPVMNSHREIANMSLRKADSIMIIGYGFNDSHLQTVLIEQLEIGMKCLIITKSLSPNAKDIIERYPSIIALEESDKGGTNVYYNSKTIHMSDNLWDLKIFIDKIIV